MVSNLSKTHRIYNSMHLNGWFCYYMVANISHVKSHHNQSLSQHRKNTLTCAPLNTYIHTFWNCIYKLYINVMIEYRYKYINTHSLKHIQSKLQYRYAKYAPSVCMLLSLEGVCMGFVWGI